MKLRASLLLSALVLVGTLPAAPQMQSLGPKDTFAAAKLSADETKQIIAAVEESAYDTPDSWIKELRVRRVDLGASPGLVLQGTSLLCGGTGNCQVFVLRKANSKWVSLFGTDQAPMAESFQFGPGTTNGIKNFTITAHSSAEAATRTTYKFDGKLYRIDRTYTA
jgi:hypothetical protein